MIKLTGVKGDAKLDLSVLGYEFPDNPNCNWYMVKASVTEKDQAFETCFPALETIELPRLLHWFENLSKLRLPQFIRECFTEPCIEFEYLSWREGSIRIKVTLHQEMKPQFSSSSGRDNWGIISELNQKDLTRIIGNLNSIIEQYPIRGDAKNQMETMQSQAGRESLYRKMVEFNPEEIEQMIAEGELKGRRKIALNMRQEGVPIEDISKYTGLTVREICGLKE